MESDTDVVVSKIATNLARGHQIDALHILLQTVRDSERVTNKTEDYISHLINLGAE